MSKHLSAIMQEADEIINNRSSAEHIKQASADLKDEEVLELASFLQTSQDGQSLEVKLASEDTDEFALNVTEKIAEALAVTECLMNLEELVKTAKFEKEAYAKGFSDQQVEEFIEKRASTPGRFKSIMKVIPWLAGGAAVAGGAGTVKGYQKGKEQGYTTALTDVNRAMEEYAG